MALVSIIIPSYNHLAYIPKAVDSVLGQTHSDLELIIVDDGSKDKSLEYLESLIDPRVRLVAQENAGAHNAINRGLGMAKGDYLAILNSDDIFHPERLAICIDRLTRTDAELVATWIEVIDQDGKALGVKEGWHNMLPWPIRHPERSFAQTNDFARNLLMTNFVSTTSNVVFSRKLYDAIGGMRNLRFAHDWDFLLRAARTFPCELIAQPLLQYRIHGSNTISSNRAWMLFEICWVLATGMAQFEGLSLYASGERDALIKDVHALGESINTQGNDRVLWMIRQFIDARRRAGDPHPELKLLDDKELRDAFITYIDTGESSVPVAGASASAVSRGLPSMLNRLAARLERGRS